MPLKHSRIPKGHTEVVQQSLHHLSDPAYESLTPSKPETPEVLRSVPIFTLGLNALFLPAALSKVKAASWRYLVRAGRGSAHAIDVSSPPTSDEAAAVRQWRFGESAEKLHKVIHSSERHKSLRRRRYGVRFLRVPALHFSALWLKADANKHDVFVPVRSMFSKLRAGRHFSREQLERVLKTEAENTLRRQTPRSS